MHGMQNAMLLTYNFTLEGHTSAFVSQNVLAMAGLGSSLQSSLMMQNLYSVRTEIGQKKRTWRPAFQDHSRSYGTDTDRSATYDFLLVVHIQWACLIPFPR